MRVALGLLILILVGCQTPDSLEKRLPLAGIDESVLKGGYPSNIRAFGDGDDASVFNVDDFELDNLATSYPYLVGKPLTILALSGGGENGAFGAGVLVGWSDLETRPMFTIVTGVSAGALIAPYAFLGPGYDTVLTDALLGITHDGIVDEKSLIGALLGDSYTKGELLAAYVDAHYSDAMIDEIAAEHRKGRRLLIGTSHLDAGRAMSWNIGAIANTTQPTRYDLIRQVLVASASIPGFFPPQFFEVEYQGRAYHEMHVDGGVTRELFYDPLKFDYQALARAMRTPVKPQVYIIRNGRLRPPAALTNDTMAPILARSMATLISAQSMGDTYRSYIGAMRDGMGFNLAYVTNDFVDKPAHQMFDSEHMRSLYNYARQKVQQDKFWLHSPLHVDPESDSITR